MARQFKEYRLTLQAERVLKLSEPVEQINGARDAERVIDAWFRAREPFGESVILLGVDGKNRLIGVVEVSRGGAHGTALSPGDVLRPALVMGASAILLSHNHPSGDPTPSHEDRQMTRALRQACEIVGVYLLDHLTWTHDAGSCSCM